MATLVWIMVALLCRMDSGGAALNGDDSFHQLVQRSKGGLLELATNRSIKELDSTRTPVRLLLERNLPVTHEKDVVDLVQGLVDLSLNEAGANPPRAYILHVQVTEILISALFHSSASVRHAALDNLATHALAAQFRAKAPRLIDAWPMNRDSQMLRLIGLTDCTEAIDFFQGLSAEQVVIPDEIAARLGSLRVESRLIDEFKAQTNAVSKSETALKLGYIASAKAVFALASEMRSGLVVDHQHYTYSVRYKILAALGKALPNEPLFNHEFQRVAHGPSYGLTVDGEAYLDRVEAWCTNSFGVTWKQPRPPYLLWRRKQIPRPFGSPR